MIDQRIVYFTANGDVAASGEVFVASLPMGSGTTDIGGFMAFAPDGTLYVGFGDQTNIDAPQDPTNPLGKILRYNDDGTIPANNPSAGSAVYASGVRDPAGMGFDPLGALGVVPRPGTERHDGDQQHPVQRELRLAGGGRFSPGRRTRTS